MPAPSGLTPSDSCYVKHLPASYGVQEVQQLFETHGAVLDVKLFPCLGGVRRLPSSWPAATSSRRAQGRAGRSVRGRQQAGNRSRAHCAAPVVAV